MLQSHHAIATRVKDNGKKLKRPYTAKSLATIEDRSANICPDDDEESLVT